MNRRFWTCVGTASLCLVLAPAVVRGQDRVAKGRADRAQAKEPSAPAVEKPLLGPKYLNLRWNEDFSYLDGEPGSYREDFFDPIKHIHFADDWTLSLGGEFRYRLEAETNKAFGGTEPAQDTFNLFRYMLHADVKYRKLFRVFVQGVAAFDEDRDLGPRGIDENRWDVHQLFFDVRVLGEDLPLTLRVGRQELQYGNQRLVSPLDWAMVRRRFDAVKLFASGETWDVDVWYAKPVIVQRKQRDRYNEEYDFYGLYVTYKGIPRHGLDAYFFASDKTPDRRNERPNPNGNRGDESRYTLGARFWGETGSFDYEAELAGQWGKWAGDAIQGWAWTVDGGYTFGDVAWKPRLGAGFDWASGDDNPRDGRVGTFDQLFPFSHYYLGFLDIVARQNVMAANVNVSAWPVPKKVKAKMTYHAFWLNARQDFLYNAPGRGVRRDPTGHSGREIGQELDLTLLWKVDAHAALLLGYSHFWENNFIQQTGVSEDADLFYVQYTYKF